MKKMMFSDFITWDMVNGWGEIGGILQSIINSWYTNLLYEEEEEFKLFSTMLHRNPICGWENVYDW